MRRENVPLHHFERATGQRKNVSGILIAVLVAVEVRFSQYRRLSYNALNVFMLVDFDMDHAQATSVVDFLQSRRLWNVTNVVAIP